MITHTQRTLLAQRIIAIACGWEDLNDHERLRIDPLMQIVTDRGVDHEQPLAGTATLCRLENRISRDTCIRLSKLLVETFIESLDAPPEELVLDFDATDDPVHGQQEGRFFHGFYGGYCFLPLYVFCGTKLLVAYLRPANIDASKHSRAIVKLLVTRLREVWPEVKITLRGDSGFCRWKLMRWCDRHHVDYIFGLAKNSRLLQMSQDLVAKAEEAFNQSHENEKQRIFGEVRYAAESWDKERRVIVKAEHFDKGSNPRFVVTSKEGDPQQLYDELYCARGEMENRIKEQQLGLFADRTSCHDFVANQFRLLLSSFAYVLIEHLRAVGLKDTALANAQVSTIRTKLLKIGALVKSSVRRLVLHLSTAFPLAELFKQVARQLLQPAGG